MYWFKRKYKLVVEVGSWLLFFSIIKILIKDDFLKSVRTSSLQIKRTLTGETLDYSGQYKIIRFYRFNGLEKKFSHNDITLVTQCSINHLHHLVDLVKVWNGPISCSIFVPNLDASVASDAITVLKRCYPKIGYYVTFHLVYPTVYRADLSKFLTENLNCLSNDEKSAQKGLRTVLKYLLVIKSYITDTVYFLVQGSIFSTIFR